MKIQSKISRFQQGGAAPVPQDPAAGGAPAEGAPMEGGAPEGAQAGNRECICNHHVPAVCAVYGYMVCI